MSSFPHVELSIDGPVATVRLARPEKKNAMSPELHQSMNEALTEVEGNGAVKVCVVTGTDDSFCGGMDLERCFLEPFDDPEKFRSINAVALKWFRQLKSLNAVTIAKVNGWCFGGGFELAGICDIIITRDDATFGLSEINFGIFPGGGTMWATAHNMPRKQALYYALTGQTFTGAQAVALGMATHAVPADQLDAEVDRVVAQLVNKNLETLRSTKSVYEWSVELDFAKSIDLEMAKLQEMSYMQRHDWIRTALTQFHRREFRPGLETYSPTSEK